MRRTVKPLILTAALASASAPCVAAVRQEIPIAENVAAVKSTHQPSIRIGTTTVYTDLTYSTVPGFRPLLLDLYVPASKGPRPLVIFVHGGSWTMGSKRLTGHYADFPGVLASLANRGFTVASIDYRLSSEAKFPAAVQDVKAAIRYLRANASRYGIDRNRVAVWGASAGAHLAAMAALTGDEPSLEPEYRDNSELSDRVQALVGWYGPYDMATMFKQAASASPAPANPGSPEAAAEAMGPLNFFGCTMQGCPPGIIEKASPVTWIDKNDPPTLLVHGTSDTTVPPDQSINFYNRLKAAGVKADLQLIDWADHSWTGPDAEETATASRKAIATTFEWLEKTMLKKKN
ncbi:MAG: alpha/beta hydrolase [Chlorobiales bacterium]|nr:alpha/beta hydrolase [Chlorobiales bacterium]